MARPLRANIPHSLGKAEARQRIQAGFAQVQKQMSTGVLGLISFQEKWENDRLHFEGGTFGQKITGRLDVTDDAVLIEVDLPQLLAALADRISAIMMKETQKLLK
jgi:hypothetical protein